MFNISGLKRITLSCPRVFKHGITTFRSRRVCSFVDKDRNAQPIEERASRESTWLHTAKFLRPRNILKHFSTIQSCSIYEKVVDSKDSSLCHNRRGQEVKEAIGYVKKKTYRKEKNFNPETFVCKTCFRTKSTNKPVTGKLVYGSLEWTSHSDVLGPMKENTYGEKTSSSPAYGHHIDLRTLH